MERAASTYAGTVRAASSRLARPIDRHGRVRFLANPRFRACVEPKWRFASRDECLIFTRIYASRCSTETAQPGPSAACQAICRYWCSLAAGHAFIPCIAPLVRLGTVEELRHFRVSRSNKAQRD